MSIEVSDFLIIIGVTSAICTASTAVIGLKVTLKVKEEFCNQINNLLVRVGILEKEAS